MTEMELTMKKLLLIALLSAICLTGCAGVAKSKFAYDTNDENTESVFVTIEQGRMARGNYYKVLYERKTKVMYVMSEGAYNFSSFTVMLDADGKPMLYEDQETE